MSTLKQAFELFRDRLNTLVPDTFLNPVSLTPKHPDFVEQDQDFPYFAIEFKGEMPEYNDSDYFWITPSREMASFRVWVAIAQSENDSLTSDLMAIVKKVRDVVVALTMDRSACDFRIRVDEVASEYEPSGRWALAVVTVTIGAYGT